MNRFPLEENHYINKFKTLMVSLCYTRQLGTFVCKWIELTGFFFHQTQHCPSYFQVISEHIPVVVHSPSVSDLFKFDCILYNLT